jgi:hypothetical protein
MLSANGIQDKGTIQHHKDAENAAAVSPKDLMSPSISQPEEKGRLRLSSIGRIRFEVLKILY